MHAALSFWENRIITAFNAFKQDLSSQFNRTTSDGNFQRNIIYSKIKLLGNIK